MKKILFALLCIVALASCNRKQPYTITGTFEIPDSLNYGDTVIAREPLDGTYVYMLELSGEVIDSALVKNEMFSFVGNIKEKDKFFAYIACEYAYGIIAVEPGEYNMTIGQEIMAYGSVTNDAINDIDAKGAEIEQGIGDRMMAAVEAAGGYPSDSIMMPFYLEFNEKYESLIDSVYQGNKENLIGVYAVNIITSGAQSLDELEMLLEDYNDYISDSPLMEARRAYLREGAARQMYQNLMSEEDFGEFEEEDFEHNH